MKMRLFLRLYHRIVLSAKSELGSFFARNFQLLSAITIYRVLDHDLSVHDCCVRLFQVRHLLHRDFKLTLSHIATV